MRSGMEHRINLTSLSKFLASQPIEKMITRLLVSLSIFSLVLISYLFSFFENFNYFSSNSFHLIMNKNFIFFICNGLLVFLAKTSGFVLSPPSSSGFDPNEMLQKRIGDGLEVGLEAKTESLLEKDNVTTLMEESSEMSKEEHLNQRAEGEVSIFIAESDEELGVEKDENESKSCWLFHDEEEVVCGPQQEDYGQEEEEAAAEEEEEEEAAEEEEEEAAAEEVYEEEEEAAEEEEEEAAEEVYEEEEEAAEEVYEEEEEAAEEVYEEEEEEAAEEEEEAYGKEEKLEMLSTEELNKKFEDFIRKMKEEIRISEVRHQLLMVN